MAKKKADEFYEIVYERLRGAASLSLAESKVPEAPLLVADAQAEALVRTLRGFTLRSLPKKEHAQYLHWFMTRFLKELTEKLPHIRAHMIVREMPRKRKVKKC